MSHAHRLLMNALLNAWFAKKQDCKKWLPWTDGPIAGTTMQPQSCYVWPGILVTGCTRGGIGRDKDVTNGVCYIVKDWDDLCVNLEMHPDYAKNYIAKVERNFPKLEPLIGPLVGFLRAAPRTGMDMEIFVEGDKKLDRGLTVSMVLKQHKGRQ